MMFTVPVYPSAKIFCAKERIIIWIIHIQKIKKQKKKERITVLSPAKKQFCDQQEERISEIYENNK